MAQAAAVGREGIQDAVSWRRAHEELVRLATKRAGLDFEEGRWLLRAFRSGAHIELGYGSFNEYAERLFGYGPRLTQEKIRVAEALEGLPETARELESGSISFSAVRELTRVAIPSTEREWLGAARGRTVRDVEQLVSGHRPGSRPDDVPDARAKRHVLRLEVSGETLAIFREAMAKVRRDAGEALDDDAAVLLLCRQLLGAQRDEGRSSYQVALTVCERCRRGEQQGRGELVEVAPEVVEMAECDGQHIGHVEPDSELERPRGRPRADHAVTHATRPREADHPAGAPAQGAAARRRALPSARLPERDVRQRASPAAPLRGRNEHTRKSRDPLRRAPSGDSCGEGRQRRDIGGRALTFLHADGTAYGASPSPASADVRAKAYRALTQLGFRESEAKRALARVPSNPNITLEHLVRRSAARARPRDGPRAGVT